MHSEPHRAWNGTHLARHLGIPTHNLLTQLAEWTRLGFIARASNGNYTLKSTNQPNP